MIVVIVGPTGVGKTALSIALAKHYQTELISGDSIQIYRELNIGSAKVTPKEQEGVKHHMIDIVDPDASYSVALFQRDVRKHIDDMYQRNQLPMIVGGTGFYIRSVLHDYTFHGDDSKTEFEKSCESLSNEALYQRLSLVDLKSTEKIHPNNRKRLIQALYRAQGSVPMSEKLDGDKKLYDYVIIGLTTKRTTLYERIDQRVEQMFKDGLVEEVKQLFDKGVQGQSIQAIGYKELYQHFNHELSLDEAKALIKKNTRRYAKRQYTFFNNQFEVKWLDVNFSDFEETITQAIAHIDQRKHQ